MVVLIPTVPLELVFLCVQAPRLIAEDGGKGVKFSSCLASGFPTHVARYDIVSRSTEPQKEQYQRL